MAEGETFHPVIGPVAEAESLYVRQLQLPERIAGSAQPFTVWDVGLGAAANVCTVLAATRQLRTPIRIVSFDKTPEPLRFALANPVALPFLAPYLGPAEQLLARRQVEFENGDQPVTWQFIEGDFPTLLRSSAAPAWPKPDAILFDAYSPARNPEMWTLPLFQRLHALLDPARPCSMATYSRSTLLRVTLLLAGFYVGAGHATGEKEETTVAANDASLVSKPLGAAWLRKVHRSSSAEPLTQPEYRQAPLSPENRDRLDHHPQFR